MVAEIIALLMIIDHEIKEHRIQDNMSTCLKHKREASRTIKDGIEYRCKQEHKSTDDNKPSVDENIWETLSNEKYKFLEMIKKRFQLMYYHVPRMNK